MTVVVHCGDGDTRKRGRAGRQTGVVGKIELDVRAHEIAKIYSSDHRCRKTRASACGQAGPVRIVIPPRCAGTQTDTP
jgi:hypothetical protein